MAGQMFPRPGGVVGGKYVLEAMLDSSAEGAVFRARHSTTGRPFAIRWLTRSARSGSSLRPSSSEHLPVADDYQNPLVLSPVDVGRTPHGTYVVMEWLNGETLASRIACEGALLLSAAAKLLVPCMRAVHELHLSHAVHGHLRPSNVFICRGLEQHPESVRVFDYSIAGAACVSESIDEHGEYTRDAYFLAPEQITKATVDQRADVYAFGVLVYLCATGQLPFAAERSDDFARWIYSQDPPALPGAPGLTPELYRFLARAMARDAGERFESCSELADTFEALAHKSEQPIVTMQRAHVVRSSRPTMRLASELPLPLAAANDPQAPHPALSRPPAAKGPSPLRATMTGMPSESLQPPAAQTSARPPQPGRVPSSLRATMTGVTGMPTGSQASQRAVRSNAPTRATTPLAAQTPGSVHPTVSRMPTVSVSQPASRVPRANHWAIDTEAPQPNASWTAAKPGSVRPSAAGLDRGWRSAEPPADLAVTSHHNGASLDPRAQLPLSMRPTAPVPIVPPPAAGVRRSHRPIASGAPFVPPPADQPFYAEPGAPPQPLAAWPLPAAKRPASLRSPQSHELGVDPQLSAATVELEVPRRDATPSGARPLRFSPSARPRSRTPESERSDPATYESTVPLELLRPREYRKPLNRGVLFAVACVALFGIIPSVAYFAPPIKDEDALSGGARTPSRLLDNDIAPPPAAAAQLLPPELAAPPTSAPPADNKLDLASGAPLVDDPTTPIDESDPLIAAALAAQENPADEQPEASAPTPKHEEAKSARKPAEAPAPKRAKTIPRVTAPAAPTPPPSQRARMQSPSSLTAEPYSTTPTKRLPWETPGARKH